MTDFWGALGLSEEEVSSARERMTNDRPVRDGRICICGHAAGRHRQALGVTRCQPARMNCPCRTLGVVAEVSDTRGFIAKTTGTGTDHALLRGVVSAERLAEKQGGKLEIEWVVDLECQRCAFEKKESEGLVLPAAVTGSGFISEKPEAKNTLLCERCIGDLSRFGASA